MGPTSPPPIITRSDVAAGLGTYYLTTLVVVLGVVFADGFMKPPDRLGEQEVRLLDRFLRFDSWRYQSIAETGYEYESGRGSEVAFFPAYPLLARLVARATGCPTAWALLAVAHAFLVVAFVALAAYARLRLADPAAAGFAVAAFGLLPTTFFFRMAYSESLFVAVTCLSLLAMERRWPAVVVALLVGLATATRPVGVALVPAFAYHLWAGSAGGRTFLARALVLLPLSCWGLIAYMAYQGWAFGEPLAFAKTQGNWRSYPDAPWAEKAQSLATFEPVWGTYVHSHGRYWERFDAHDNPLFSLLFANPAWFGLTAVLVALGAWRRWLKAEEILLAAGLLLIPYVTKGYDNSMMSAGRFAAVVVPAYLVAGRLLANSPGWLNGGLLGLGGFLLGAYSALFAAHYLLF